MVIKELNLEEHILDKKITLYFKSTQNYLDKKQKKKKDNAFFLSTKFCQTALVFFLYMNIPRVYYGTASLCTISPSLPNSMNKMTTSWSRHQSNHCAKPRQHEQESSGRQTATCCRECLPGSHCLSRGWYWSQPVYDKKHRTVTAYRITVQ